MIFWVAVSVSLIVIFGVSILNALTFPRLRNQLPTESPSVSILIPARNEAKVIAATLQTHLNQGYPNFEVCLLDDASIDKTGEIAAQIARGDGRFRLLQGQPLPTGWLGKNWACHQLAQTAQHDILVFTDADVQWQAEALSAVIALFEKAGADMLTVWPTQQTTSWGERLVVPLMALAIIGYLPEFLVRYSSFAAFAAANGQCIVIRRAAYTKIGGHGAVRANIVEDVTLAKHIKAAGFRLVMADGNHLIQCRMYQGWREVRDGFAKNILAGHGNSIPFLLFSTAFHWLVFVGPLIWLIAGAFLNLGPAWPSWPLMLIGLGIGVRGISAAVTHQRLWDAIWMPISVMLMTVIALRSIQWKLRGGPQWKGRVITHE